MAILKDGKRTYEGAVLSACEGRWSGYDLQNYDCPPFQDVSVWNEAIGAVVRVACYRDDAFEVDASQVFRVEIARKQLKSRTWAEADEALRPFEDVTDEAAGCEAVVVKGRKLPIGSNVTVIRTGESAYGRYVLVQTADGQRVAVNPENVQIDVAQYAPDWQAFVLRAATQLASEFGVEGGATAVMSDEVQPDAATELLAA